MTGRFAATVFLKVLRIIYLLKMRSSVVVRLLLTANAEVATVLGSIPASSESPTQWNLRGGRWSSWIQYIKKIQIKNMTKPSCSLHSYTNIFHHYLDGELSFLLKSEAFFADSSSMNHYKNGISAFSCCCSRCIFIRYLWAFSRTLVLS
jgi:hypothetical protein